MSKTDAGMTWACTYGIIPTIRSLLSKGQMINQPISENDDSALHVAALNGKEKVVKFLLNTGADIDIKNLNDETPLHVAALKGQLDVIQALLDDHASMNIKDKDGRTPLHVAASNGHTETIKFLLDAGTDINVKDKKSYSKMGNLKSKFEIRAQVGLLFRSTEENVIKLERDEVLKVPYKCCCFQLDPPKGGIRRESNLSSQLQSLSSVNHLLSKKQEGHTALYWAATKGHVKATKVLWDKENDLYVGGKRRTLLHEAANHGKEDVIKTLLKSEVDVNYMDEKNRTPLHEAATAGQVHVMKMLLEAHADPNMADKNKRTSLHEAAENGHVKATKTLLDMGADLSVTEESGWTLLHYSASKGYLKILSTLLEAGANANTADKHNKTPLHEAAGHGKVMATTILVNADADINVADENQRTPIHLAAMNDNMEDLIVLLLGGGSIQAKDHEEKTALELAAERTKLVLRAWPDVPEELHQLGPTAVGTFLRSVSKGSFPSNLIRCMFVGNFGVGKTTLVYKLFDSITQDITSTNGIDVYLGKCYYNKKEDKWHIQEEHSEFVLGVEDIVQIDFWDFAGQLIFYTTHQTYMSRRCLYFLVFDLSMGLHGEVDDENLDPVDSNHRQVIDFLEFWIGSIRLYARGEKKDFPKIIIIGTHKDKVQNVDDLQNIKSEICDKFSHLIQSGQLIVRDELFLDILSMSKEQIDVIRGVILHYGEQYPEYGEQIPASWMELHKKLYELKRTGQRVLAKKDLAILNEKNDNSLQDDELELFLLYLHNIGYVLYFNDSGLRDLVILDPKWIIEAMKCIFTCELFWHRLWDRSVWQEMRATGKVKNKYIEKVWKRHAESPLYHYRHHLLLVMEKLDLICKPKLYDRKGNDLNPAFYYIPSMINADIPSNRKREISHGLVLLIYQFMDIIPPALYNRLISSCLCLWQVHNGHLYNGLVTLQSGRFHLLEIQRAYRKITVSIIHTRSDRPDVNLCRAIRRFVTETINRILATYKITRSERGSKIFEIVYNDVASALGVSTFDKGTFNMRGTDCSEQCKGLTETEKGIELCDKALMHIALDITDEHQLMRLSAHLVGSVKFFEDIKRDFQELRHADFAFFILHEWKVKRLSKGSRPSARRLAKLMKRAEINEHLLCMALRLRDKEAHLNAVFQMKEPTAELLDAVADKLSKTYIHVGVELGLHLDEILRLRMNHRNNTLAIIREILRFWIEKNTDEAQATIAWLATALLNSHSNIEVLFDLEDVSLPSTNSKICTLL